MTLLCLTTRQPWQWAVTHLAKETRHHKGVENRSWKTPYRGELGLHAGSRSRWDAFGQASRLVLDAWDDWLIHTGPVIGAVPTSPLTRRSELITFGAVEAVTELLDVHHARACGAELPGLCSRWAVPDQYHWVYGPVRVLAEPVPVHGRLQLWAAPDEVEAKVRAQLAAA